MKRKRFTLIELLVVISSFAILMIFVWPKWNWKSYSPEYKCRLNLLLLHAAMQRYTNDYVQYPTPNKWCDLLLEYTDVDEKRFKCPELKKGRSHYAMNPNCSPNSPPDIVLLFETEDGWNQFGGPELLTTKHHKGKGCNMLFNGDGFEFVKKEQLGNLNWGDEQKE